MSDHMEVTGRKTRIEPDMDFQGHICLKCERRDYEVIIGHLPWFSGEKPNLD